MTKTRVLTCEVYLNNTEEKLIVKAEFPQMVNGDNLDIIIAQCKLQGDQHGAKYWQRVKRHIEKNDLQWLYDNFYLYGYDMSDGEKRVI